MERALGIVREQSVLPLRWEEGVPMAIAMGAAIAVAVVLYLVMVVLTCAVTKEDLRLIPMGEKLAAMLHLR